MGFSPGDFVAKIRGRIHWELKDNSIVLWTDREDFAILELTCEQADIASRHLALLVQMSEPDEDH